MNYILFYRIFLYFVMTCLQTKSCFRLPRVKKCSDQAVPRSKFKVARKNVNPINQSIDQIFLYILYSYALFYV